MAKRVKLGTSATSAASKLKRRQQIAQRLEKKEKTIPKPAKELTQGKIWCFALGQFGWSLLAALISSYVTAYYVPDAKTIEAGQPLFIQQGAIFLGITILGLITGLGRVFDAVTDPLVGSLSDRCRSKAGRRIPFMRAAAIPFGLVTVLTLVSPVNGESWVNALFLFVMMMLFYLFMTVYCTPFNALIPELGTTQKTRMSISTTISFTYIAGMAIAYTRPPSGASSRAPSA